MRFLSGSVAGGGEDGDPSFFLTPKSLTHSFIYYIFVEGLLCENTVLNGENEMENQTDGVTVPRAYIPYGNRSGRLGR